MPATPQQQLALLQLALQEQAANLTPASRMGQSNQGMPGRVPSALALNAYVQGMPSAGDRDQEYEANRTQQRMDDAAAQMAETKARLADPLEAAKAAAGARGFETRRGVREAAAPIDFNEANFPLAVNHSQPKKISRVAADLDPNAKPIRRFTDAGAGFTDPDAAMGAAQRTMLDPRVVAAEVTAGGRNAAAQATIDDKAKTAAAAKAASDDQAAEIVRLATKLKNSPYLNANVGVLDQWMPTVRGGSREFEADAERLQNLLSLESRSQLKGQGAVSDFEGRMLSKSATSLRPGLDEPSYRAELDRIISEKSRGRGRQIGRFTVEDSAQ